MKLLGSFRKNIDYQYIQMMRMCRWGHTAETYSEKAIIKAINRWFPEYLKVRRFNMPWGTHTLRAQLTYEGIQYLLNAENFHQGGICAVCGCTDFDCRRCMRATGQRCSWVNDDQTVCSACAVDMVPDHRKQLKRMADTLLGVHPSNMAIYHGKRVAGVPIVLIDDDLPLYMDPSRSVRDYTLDGFDWGNRGPGALQLSLAILLDCMTKEEALLNHIVFCWDVVARFPEEWRIDTGQILQWLEYQKASDLCTQ